MLGIEWKRLFVDMEEKELHQFVAAFHGTMSQRSMTTLFDEFNGLRTVVEIARNEIWEREKLKQKFGKKEVA